MLLREEQCAQVVEAVSAGVQQFAAQEVGQHCLDSARVVFELRGRRPTRLGASPQVWRSRNEAVMQLICYCGALCVYCAVIRL